MQTYINQITIPYYDTDKNGYVRPETLLTYMGEASSLHSDSLGVGVRN